MKLKANNFFLKNVFYFLFLSFFALGLSIFKDYGISIDEEFQRYSGFYWLNYVVEFTPFETLKINISNRLDNIGGFTLPDPRDYPFYGIVFDLPLAFLETIFDIKEPKNYFLLRHFFNFLIFFISSIYFYKILENRFSKKSIIFLGVLLYISSPRIFADSFYNNKDIVFLSFVTISSYYYFKLLDNFSYKNIFKFSFFSALTCATRILGIFIPITFLFFIFLSNEKKNKNYRLFKKIFLFVSLFLFFLYLFWPFLWGNPISNFFYSLKMFSQYEVKLQMLFNGDYIFSNFLPLSYLPTWILITTPVSILILFFIGYTNLIKRSSGRIINIKQNTIYEDFWRGKKEKKDFFIIFNFTIIFFYIILSNTVLYTGWRHLYFLHIFIVYISCFAIYLIDLKIKKKFISFLILTILILANFEVLNFYYVASTLTYP